MRGTQSRGDAGGSALLLVDEHHRFIERPVSSSTTITEIGRNGPSVDACLLIPVFGTPSQPDRNMGSAGEA